MRGPWGLEWRIVRNCILIYRTLMDDLSKSQNKFLLYFVIIYIYGGGTMKPAPFLN